MIRFVDLGSQLQGIGEEDKKAFCFYNTVADEFLRFGDVFVWGSLEEFVSDCHLTNEYNRDVIDRCTDLVPTRFRASIIQVFH